MTTQAPGHCPYCDRPSWSKERLFAHPCCRISITKKFKPSEWCPCLSPQPDDWKTTR